MALTDVLRGHQVAEPSPLIVERLLRDRDDVWRQIKSDHDLIGLIRRLVVTSALALGGYGAIMGVWGGLGQALSSAIKLPLLFLVTLAICLPTLYLFNLLYGGRLSARQVLALALTAITVTAALTLAFAPVSLFFLLTAHDYDFFKLLNVAILALTGFAGVSFLVDGMRHMNTPAAPASPPADAAGTVASEADGPAATRPARAAPRLSAINMPLLQVWLLLYGFVGTQLGWTLRPFFGAPGLGFQIFRELEGNFYVHLAQVIFRLLRG